MLKLRYKVFERGHAWIFGNSFVSDISQQETIYGDIFQIIMVMASHTSCNRDHKP